MDPEQFAKFLDHQTKMFGQLLTKFTPPQHHPVPAVMGPNVAVPQPSPLALDGDMEQNFEFFEKSWFDYSKAVGMDHWPDVEDSQKVSFLMSVIGEPARRKYFNFELTDAQKATVQNALQAIREKVTARRNIIVDRLDFFSASQYSSETIDDYASRLKILAKSAKFGALETELVTYKVVTANKWSHLRTKMLTVSDITLLKAIDMCRAEEIAAKRSIDMSIASSSEVKKIIKPKSKNLHCKFCGDRHEFLKGVCPALGKRCHRCKGKNHFEKVCHKRYQKSPKHPKRVKEITEESSESEESSSETSSGESEGEYEIGKIYDNTAKGGNVLAKLDLKFSDGWKSVKCELDTGANTSLIGNEYLTKLCGNQPLLPSKLRLQSFGGNPIKVLGEVKIPCRRKNREFMLILQVVNGDHCPLLSAKVSRVLGFVKFCKSVSFEKSSQSSLLNIYRVEAQRIVDAHANIFAGYGRLPGTVSLEVDNSISPIIQSPRRVPIAMRDKLKKELESLEKEGLIVKELKHTQWVSNIVIVQRGTESSGIRICLDPIPLNKALKRPNLQFVTLDEILPELGRAKVFTTMDAKKGFWHVVLDEHSSKLTTFWTPFGRYRWTRLPFGISSAPEIFQMKLQEVIQGLKGVECIADDLLVYGTGDDFETALIDHNQCLEKLLTRLEDYNVKLNKSKMKLCETSVKFYGHMLTDQGIKPDDSKISTIRNFPTPTNRKEVHRFIGMVNYLSRFIQNLSANLVNLRKLIVESVPWQWTAIEEEEFSRIKSRVADIGTLRYYNINQPLIVECDASCFGLGVVVYQKDGVIGYASRTLTQTERNYAQIEKELLAILFACIRFDQIIVGNKKTVVKTDHKPLVSLFKKPLLSAPRRLQHMLLNLQRYSLSIEFVTGKDNVVADALSRAPVDEKLPSDCFKKLNICKIGKEVEVLQLSKFLSVSDNRLTEIKKETSNDQPLQLIISYIQQGWPPTVDRVPDTVKVYYGYRSELSTQDGLVFRGDRIVVPYVLRRKLIDSCHVSHNGVESTLKLARANLFWPGMSSQIKNVVKECQTCAKYAASQPNPPMMSHCIPIYPFQLVSMDVFQAEYRGFTRKFLATVDHYSDFFEVDILKDLTPESVIDVCKANFARHGKPQRVISDNATNFVNAKMIRFANDWDFELVTSAPHHQQANGKSEAAVKIAKRLIKKAEETGTDFWYALLHWRNIPNKIGSSPAARLFSRSTRCGIPTSSANLLPRVVEGVPAAIEKNRTNYKQYYDKKTRQLPELLIGSPVYVQLHPETSKLWTAGTITDRLSERSYKVNVDGVSYRRSSIHLKPRNEPNTLNELGHISLQNTGFREHVDSNNIIMEQKTSSENLFQNASLQQPASMNVPEVSLSSIPVPAVYTPARERPTQKDRVAITPVDLNSRPKRQTRIPEKLKDFDVTFQ
ncbi:uncharacterized protein K02A2.6-like [Malaya genurostris]|uniref:uncharacterized protein K02A2.6-like n=1 Tax=Malaya genurostris TaxID=325434 RepID=UPI0026F3F9D2|nr:uncharacterized protein K02A2.6-like [Malaya genurostris]